MKIPIEAVDVALTIAMSVGTGMGYGYGYGCGQMGQALLLAIVTMAPIHFATGGAYFLAVRKSLPENPLLLKWQQEICSKE